MARVKRGTIKNKNRKNILAKAKGYRFGRKNKKSVAYEAISHAGNYAFAHRRKKKGDFRTLWNTKISALAKENGTSYSKLIANLKKNEIVLNRKALAELAEFYPVAFAEVVKSVTK